MGLGCPGDSAGVRRRGLAGCGGSESGRGCRKGRRGARGRPDKAKRASREHANDDDQQGSEQHGERTGIHGPESDRGRRNWCREWWLPSRREPLSSEPRRPPAKDHATRMRPSLIWSNSKPHARFRPPRQARPEHGSMSNQRRSVPEPDLSAFGRRELSLLGISGGHQAGDDARAATPAAQVGRTRRPYSTNRGSRSRRMDATRTSGGQTR